MTLPPHLKGQVSVWVPLISTVWAFAAASFVTLWTNLLPTLKSPVIPFLSVSLKAPEFFAPSPKLSLRSTSPPSVRTMLSFTLVVTVPSGFRMLAVAFSVTLFDWALTDTTS